jgi:hypothetical protein
LALYRVASENDVFLKASGIVDDELTFGKNYKIVLANETLLKDAVLTEDGSALRGIDAEGSEDLYNAAMDVIYALEQVGIIFHYATNKRMIAEYLGETVVKAHRVLNMLITNEQSRDPELYERFTGMNNYCSRIWPAEVAGRLPYTN